MSDLEDRQRAADELGEALATLAARAAAKATVRLRARLAEAQSALVGAWIAMFGSVGADPRDSLDAARFVPAAHARLAEALDATLVDPRPLVEAWVAAYALGVRSTGGKHPASFEVPPFDVVAPVARAATRAIGTLSASAVNARGFSGVTVALARAQNAVHGIEALAAFETHRAASLAVSHVAREQGWHRIWIAERDACLHCLAYAGQTSDGAVFPTGLTFGDRSLTPPGLLVGPPLHPHCRCVVQLHDPGDTAVVESLKREARRSVLRGEALDSKPERLRAADRLLAVGADLPKTVQERARRAVRRGEFEDRSASRGR